MARILLGVAVLALLVGGAFWLAGRHAETPLVRVEKTIPTDALPR